VEAFLEEIALNAWPSVRQIHYDNWVLRFSGGQSRRANSVNILGPSSIDLCEKIAFCEEAYARFGMPTIFKFAGVPGTEELESLLDRSGYLAEGQTDVMTRPLAGIGTPVDADVRLDIELQPDWLETAYRLGEVPEFRRPYLEKIFWNIAPPRCFASISSEGTTAAIGAGVVERGWVGIFDIATVPEFRRQGHATRLIHHLMHWAKQMSAHSAYLQVAQGNLAAEALYKNLGFSPCYQYWYRAKRPSA